MKIPGMIKEEFLSTFTTMTHFQGKDDWGERKMQTFPIEHQFSELKL